MLFKALRHVEKSLRGMNKSKAEFTTSLTQFLLLCYKMTAARISREPWWTNQEFFSAYHSTMVLHAHISSAG
jgi:hypothetical protein